MKYGDATMGTYINSFSTVLPTKTSPKIFTIDDRHLSQDEENEIGDDVRSDEDSASKDDHNVAEQCAVRTFSTRIRSYRRPPARLSVAQKRLLRLNLSIFITKQVQWSVLP